MKRESESSDRVSLDRREFIVAVGAVAVAYAPIATVVHAASAAATSPAVLLDDWTIDDMWGVYPRPHEAIGYGRPREDLELRAALDPVVAGLMA